MRKYSELNENEKKKVKRNILIGAGGVVLFLGASYLVGKKVGKGDSLKMSTQVGDIARDTIVTNPIPLPADTTKIWKEIDEEIFTDIALGMENALIDKGIDTFHLDRSWDVAEGITKTLNVTVDTIKN